MASHTMAPSIWTSFGRLFGGLAKDSAHKLQSEPSASDLRAERDFINEMVWNNPDAFSSELDVQNMLNCYPGRF